MKNYFSFIVICLLFLQCQNKIRNNSDDLESSFKSFIQDFKSDSSFQAAHIKYPIKKEIYDVYGEDKIIDYISEEEWIHLSFKNQSESNEQDKFEMIINSLDNNSIVYIMKGIDNGILIEYIFEKKNSDWILVEIKNKST